MFRLMDRATALWPFPVLGRDKGGLVRRLVTRHRPRAAVEVGSLFGYSAILIAAALPRSGRLTCVEANEYLGRFVEANVAEAGLGSRVRVVRGDGRRVLATLRGRVDFALIASGPIPVAARRPRLAAALNGCGTRLGSRRPSTGAAPASGRREPASLGGPGLGPEVRCGRAFSRGSVLGPAVRCWRAFSGASPVEADR
jgi:hypothetical protein